MLRADLTREAVEGRRSLDRFRVWTAALYVGYVKRGTTPYAGTVPAHVKAKRRAKGKVAKASRRVNRGR